MYECKIKIPQYLFVWKRGFWNSGIINLGTWGHTLVSTSCLMCTISECSEYTTSQESFYIHIVTYIYIHTYTCIHLPKCRGIHVYTHTYIHTYIHTYKLQCICMYGRTYIHAHIHVRTHTHMHRPWIYRYADIYAYICTYTQGAYIYVYIYIYMRTYMHAHTCACVCVCTPRGRTFLEYLLLGFVCVSMHIRLAIKYAPSVLSALR